MLCFVCYNSLVVYFISIAVIISYETQKVILYIINNVGHIIRKELISQSKVFVASIYSTSCFSIEIFFVHVVTPTLYTYSPILYTYSPVLYTCMQWC